MAQKGDGLAGGGTPTKADNIALDERANTTPASRGIATPIVELAGSELCTTSLAVAEGTGNEHRAVLQLIRNRIDKFQHFGTVAFQMRKSGGRTTQVALLNEHQATLLIMFMRNNEVVTEFKVKLVAAFFQMARCLKRQPIDLRDPSQVLALLVDHAKAELQLQREVTAAAPAIEFHAAVSASTNLQPISSVAKALNIGEIRLFRWLREQHILLPTNIPYQQHIDLGRFRVVERVWRDANHEPRATPQTMVTGKGIAYITKRWLEAQVEEKA